MLCFYQHSKGAHSPGCRGGEAAPAAEQGWWGSPWMCSPALDSWWGLPTDSWAKAAALQWSSRDQQSDKTATAVTWCGYKEKERISVPPGPEGTHTAAHTAQGNAHTGTGTWAGQESLGHHPEKTLSRASAQCIGCLRV